MYIHVKVTAGAKTESLTLKSPDHLLISVREPAKNNQANKRVISLLAEHFKLPEQKIRLISGHHSSSKLFSIA